MPALETTVPSSVLTSRASSMTAFGWSPLVLCCRLLDIERHDHAVRQAAAGYLRDTTAAVMASVPEVIRAQAMSEPTRLVESLAKKAQKVAATHSGSMLNPGQAARVLTRFAPQRLLAGCALQGLARADNNHELLACAAHRLQSVVMGNGRHADHAGVRYRRALVRAGVMLPAIRSARLPAAFPWDASDWQAPALRLSLGTVPLGQEMLALGAAFFEAVAGLPALVSDSLRLVDDRAADIEASIDAAWRAMAIDVLSELLSQDSAYPGEQANGIVAGFLASAALLEAWLTSSIAEIACNPMSPAQAMLDLVVRKGQHARGYHGRLRLGDEAFDDLIVRDPAAFVEKLASSPWVKPGQPSQSPLLTRLVAFGGPMFRVFSDEELDVLQAWINALGAGASVAPRPGPSRRAPLATAAASNDPEAARGRPRGLHIRDRYLRLLDGRQHDDVRHEAREFANDWLERHARRTRVGAPPPFEVYSHERLRAWFDDRSASQARSYVEGATVMDRSREDVIDEALQLAPMILVDGAWLQRWGHAGMCDTPIGALLFKIFSDEIGNGRIEWNHPNIYRRMLSQMNLDLPDFRRREFAWDPRFEDRSFEVPVFWLSVSQYPLTYLPETLGLNLAMELSGVGGSYRTAREELRQHGFETLFVDLHNTIDNVSSGHSAMALEAIQLHMDDALCTGSPSHAAREWRRVWTGFLALSPAPRRWRDAWLRFASGR